MQVGEQNVDPPAALQVDAERPDSGAGVEDQLVAARERHLDARGVAAVAVHMRPRRRHGAARAPHLDLHQPPPPVLRERPEQDHRARRPMLGGDDRKRARLDRDPLAVSGSDREGAVRGTSGADRLGGRHGVDLERGAVPVERAERLGPLLGAHPARVLERAPEERRSRFVVEDYGGVGVEEKRGGGDARQQVAGEDQLERLLRSRAGHALRAPFFHRSGGFDTVSPPTANACDPARAQGGPSTPACRKYAPCNGARAHSRRAPPTPGASR